MSLSPLLLLMMMRRRRRRGDEGCTNLRRLVAQGTKFCRLSSNIFSIISATVFCIYKKCVGYQAKRPYNCEVHRSLQNCESSVWNLLHVALNLEVALSFVTNWWTLNDGGGGGGGDDDDDDDDDDDGNVLFIILSSLYT